MRASPHPVFSRLCAMYALGGLYQDHCRAFCTVRWPGNFLVLPFVHEYCWLHFKLEKAPLNLGRTWSARVCATERRRLTLFRL